MAKTLPQQPPLVSLFTNHDKKTVEILVGGMNGTLSLEVYQDGPTIVITDPERGPGKFKAICELKANGRIRGGFVAEKCATGRLDRIIWSP